MRVTCAIQKLLFENAAMAFIMVSIPRPEEPHMIVHPSQRIDAHDSHDPVFHVFLNI